MAARLRTVPEVAPRALGLIRVSKERDEMLSPDLQRTAIEDLARRRGYTIVDWIEGLDESGSRRKSPWWAKLDRAVEAVEQRDVDIIVVWRFDRTARNRLRWAVALDRVETAGGLIESATEPFDTSTRTGRFTRGMLGELAAYRAEEIGDTWREVHARRISLGLPANGKARFGYRVVDGLHRPIEAEAPVLAQLYRRYVAGESMRSLVAWLNREGVRTVPGYSRAPGPWSAQGLTRMLDAGFGAGLLRLGTGTKAGPRFVRGAHEPVIDKALWEAYLAARASRRTLRRVESSHYLLSGMVSCGHVLPSGDVCGMSMAGGVFGAKPARGWMGMTAFRCWRAQSVQSHPAKLVRMAVVESAVKEWVARLASEVQESSDAAIAQRARTARRRTDAQVLGREVIELDEALTRLTVDRARGTVPEGAYVAARDELTAQRERVEIRRLQAEVESREGEPAAVAADLIAHWDVYAVEHLRGGLRRLIGRVVASPERVEVVAAWSVNS